MKLFFITLYFYHIQSKIEEISIFNQKIKEKEERFERKLQKD